MMRKFVCECNEFRCELNIDVKDEDADFTPPQFKCHQPHYDAFWGEVKQTEATIE